MQVGHHGLKSLTLLRQLQDTQRLMSGESLTVSGLTLLSSVCGEIWKKKDKYEKDGGHPGCGVVKCGRAERWASCGPLRDEGRCQGEKDGCPDVM